MKRIFISFLLSISFFMAFISSSVFLATYKVISIETSKTLSVPVRFPVLIYLYLFGFEVPGRDAKGNLITVGLMLSGLVFYMIVAYCLLFLLAKYRKVKTIGGSEKPPEPPSFE